MDKLWKRLNQLFAQQQKQRPEPPFVHNNIESPLITELALSQWRIQIETYDFFQHINNAFSAFELGTKPSKNSVQFIKADATFGCAIHCKDFSDLEDFDFLSLLEHLKVQLQSEGYVKNLGDMKSRMQGQNLEKIYRYYMKPSLRLSTDSLTDQLYGNITITYTVKNGLPYLVKLICTSYSDRKYKTATPYQNLMEVLFD